MIETLQTVTVHDQFLRLSEAVLVIGVLQTITNRMNTRLPLQGVLQTRISPQLNFYSQLGEVGNEKKMSFFCCSRIVRLPQQKEKKTTTIIGLVRYNVRRRLRDAECCHYWCRHGEPRHLVVLHSFALPPEALPSPGRNR